MRPLVGGKYAQVADDRFGNLQHIASALTCDILRQHQVDTVAGEDEACNARECGNGNGNGTHAGAERSSQEATVAGRNKRALGEWLASSDRVTNHSANQLLGNLIAFWAFALTFGLHEIGGLNELLGPWLIAERIGCDDCAHGKRAGRDQDLRSGRLRRFGRRDRGRIASTEHRSRHEGSKHGNHQRSHQQDEFFPIHDELSS